MAYAFRGVRSLSARFISMDSLKCPPYIIFVGNQRAIHGNMTNTTQTSTIVIAWTETETVVVQVRRTDLGERPLTREVVVGRSCVWANQGTRSDHLAALKYARREGYSVYSYATTETDPLGRARREVVA